MTRVFDLDSERDKRTKPDAEFVRLDDAGNEIYAFSLEYKFRGEDWGTNLWAYSMDDAVNRAVAMRETMFVAGQIYSENPA